MGDEYCKKILLRHLKDDLSYKTASNTSDPTNLLINETQIKKGERYIIKIPLEKPTVVGIPVGKNKNGTIFKAKADGIGNKKNCCQHKLILDLDECSKKCNNESVTYKKENCEKKCKSLKRGFDHPVFFSSSIPRTILDKTWSKGENKKKGGGKTVTISEAQGSALTTQILTLDTNLIKALFTGEGRKGGGGGLVLGKNYAKPMDLELKIPLSNEYINADCRDPTTNDKKKRHMYIRGIPRGNITEYLGINLNLPMEPVDWTTGWASLYQQIPKKRLEIILKELKNMCFSFLYDTRVNTTNTKQTLYEWSPIDKLSIPGDCLKHLKNIATTSEYNILKNFGGGSLKGLIPSIIEDVVDMNPVSLLRKSGVTNGTQDDKCVTITENLGAARYEEPKLTPYTFEVFTNFTEQNRFKIICMLIVVIVLFLNLIYNIE